MRSREKALEATEAAAAAAAEKRQAEVEMNLSASERLAALHQTYIAKIAAPSANAADAVASGASTPRGGGGWRSPPPQTPTRAALRAEAETNARRSVATAEEAQGRLKERRASYQAERLDERERVRDTPPDPPRPAAHRHHHLRLHHTATFNPTKPRLPPPSPSQVARELRQLRAELKAVAKASEYKEAHAASARAQLVAQQAEAKACEKEAEQQDHLIRTLQVTDDAMASTTTTPTSTSTSPPPHPLRLTSSAIPSAGRPLAAAAAGTAAGAAAAARSGVVRGAGGRLGAGGARGAGAGRRATAAAANRSEGDHVRPFTPPFTSPFTPSFTSPFTPPFTPHQVIEGMEEYCAQLQAGLASQAADAKEAKEGKDGKEIVPGRELIKTEVEEVRGRLALLKREESRLTTALGEQRRALNTQEAEFAAEMRRCQEQREAKAAALAQLEKYEGELRKAA